MKNNNKHRIGALFLIIILCMGTLTAAGCGESETSEDSVTVGDEKISIGMCFDSFVIERWEKDRDVFVSTARELGAEVNVQNANGEISKQIDEIEYFIDKGVDAIVIISIDADSLTDVVKKAKNKGIKIIAYDRMINNADVDLYISFDNEMVGMLMAQALADEIASPEALNTLKTAEISRDTEDENVDKEEESEEAGIQDEDVKVCGRVLMLQGSPTDNNVEQVKTGFTSVAEAYGIEIADSMYCDGWRAEDASDYLYANPEILDEVDAIMCGNDNLATAVVRVLSEKRKAGEILVVGQDADLEACQRIVEGTQVMTVYKPVEKLAEAAAEATVNLVKGLQSDTGDTIYDGTYDIPCIVLDPIAVTRSNIDEVIIASGFHLKEEVYMNVIK